jgi:hypothetical protein
MERMDEVDFGENRTGKLMSGSADLFSIPDRLREPFRVTRNRIF